MKKLALLLICACLFGCKQEIPQPEPTAEIETILNLEQKKSIAVLSKEEWVTAHFQGGFLVYWSPSLPPNRSNPESTEVQQIFAELPESSVEYITDCGDTLLINLGGQQ